MALDQAYFDAIQIDLVKRKYYNAGKVEALLDDIRAQALALQAENESLRRQLGQLSVRKEEIGDTLLSAKSIARQILQEAQAQGDAIVAAAEERSREMLAAVGPEASVQRMEACYSRVRGLLLGCVESLNAEWQDYLCSLGEDSASPPPPADLDEKVGAIAREIFAINGEDPIAAESFEA